MTCIRCCCFPCPATEPVFKKHWFPIGEAVCRTQDKGSQMSSEVSMLLCRSPAHPHGPCAPQFPAIRICTAYTGLSFMMASGLNFEGIVQSAVDIPFSVFCSQKSAWRWSAAAGGFHCPPPCISVLAFETGLYPGPVWPRTHCVAQPGVQLRSSSHLGLLSAVIVCTSPTPAPFASFSDFPPFCPAPSPHLLPLGLCHHHQFHS